MNLLLEGAIESSLILIVALAATALLRGRPAALRHAVLAAAIACAAIAPVLGRAVPAWQLPSPLAAMDTPTPSGGTTPNAGKSSRVELTTESAPNPADHVEGRPRREWWDR